MQFSQKIIDLTANPKFFNRSKSELKYLCHVHLNSLKVDLIVFFNTVKKEELEVEMANYFTEYKGEYLGVIDGLFALIQNRPIEAIDRFPIKELDFYLRDDSAQSAFSGYSQQIYEILAIGEKIKELIYGEKKLGFQYNPKTDGEFFDLSSSEQYELLEDLFAYYVYPDPSLPDRIEVLEVTEDAIILASPDNRVMRLIKEKLFI